MVDGFIGHMLLCPCNQVITAKDRVPFFQSLVQEPGSEFRSKAQADSEGGMGWEMGKSLLLTFTFWFLSCLVFNE